MFHCTSCRCKAAERTLSMEYKIGMVAKMTGLSPSGIRFLEEIGIVSPSGGRKGSYRSYSMANVSELLDYRNYRKCGLSQEEIEILSHNSSPELSREILDRRCQTIEKEIQENVRLLSFLRRRYRDTELIGRKDDFCELISRPAIIRIPVGTAPEKIKEWDDDMGFQIPYTDSVLVFGNNEILSAQRPIEAEAGIGILEDDVSLVSFLGLPEAQYFPRKKVLHCICEIGEDFSLSVSELEMLREKIKTVTERDGIIIKGDGLTLTKRIMSGHEDGKPCRYDHIWIETEQ